MKVCLPAKKKLLCFGLVLLLLSGLFVLYSSTQKKDLSAEPQIRLYLSSQNQVIQMPLEEYLLGTVAAEMPASFGMEALKAQAVCARTYAIRKIIEGRSYPKGAQLSDDINSCQAYISQEGFAARNPSNYQALWAKIGSAVRETRGVIMLYDGQPIDALYHSTCGGQTESARNSGGREISYLQSVPCSYCASSRYYESVQVFSSPQLRSLLKVTAADPVINLKITSRSSSGRVLQMELNGKPLYAETFRSCLQLPSTWWKISLQDDKLSINSRGYGHGLGLCQYGAGGMAADKKDYLQILHYYYQGVEVSRLDY